MATVTEVTVVELNEVEPVVLGVGSWSRILLSSATAAATGTTLGYSVFAPGFSTMHLSHETEELAYVVSGSGLIQLARGVVELSVNHACHIPSRVWHSVVNPNDDAELAMVFVFASPEYPPTERSQIAVREPSR